MPTIRDMFHEIGNWHNKISVAAGLAKITLKQKSQNKPIVKNSGQVARKLAELEKLALGADKSLLRLKDVIYNRIDPDTGKVRKAGRRI